MQNQTNNRITNPLTINLDLNKNGNLSKFIITIKKQQQHINLPDGINFSLLLQKEYENNLVLLANMPNNIKKFKEIIIDESDYFNIYVDLFGQTLTKQEIIKFRIPLNGVLYVSDQIIDYENDEEVYNMLDILYPFLSYTLIFILDMCHQTNSINRKLVEEQILKIKPELKEHQIKLKQLVEVIVLYNTDRRNSL